MFKKIAILIATFAISTGTYAEFKGPGATLSVVSVNSVNDLDDDEIVALEGYIVKKTGEERYLFKDKTGQIKVEIDDKKLKDITVTPETLVRIIGEVDNDWFSIQVDVDSVEIIDK